MAWLYHRSATWRKVVSFAGASPLYMGGFAVATLGVSMFLGDRIMSATNGTRAEEVMRERLQSRHSVDGLMHVQAQRDRLQVLLDEVKERKEGERYKAALE